MGVWDFVRIANVALSIVQVLTVNVARGEKRNSVHSAGHGVHAGWARKLVDVRHSTGQVITQKV